MRLSQLPIAGLILVVLITPRLLAPGMQVASTPVGHAQTAQHRPGEDSTKKSSRVKEKQKESSGKKSDGPQSQADDNSPSFQLVQTLCRLNPPYNQDQARRQGYLPQTAQSKASAPDPGLAAFPGCLGDPLQSKIQITSIMAALEDPKHSHLGLETDRTIDVIQMAAAKRGYNPYSHFLPWMSAEDEENSTEPADRNTIPHTPGLLVFRQDARPSLYLAVFLIPELPTTGLDEQAFFSAEQIMDDVRTHTHFPIPVKDEPVIWLAGPNFSGSMASLRDADATLRQSDPHASIRAFSGSMTDAPSNPFPSNPDSRLRLTLTSDSCAIQAFVNAMNENGVGPDEIAVVTEEGTEFGNQFSEAPGNCSIQPGVLFLHFPREISKLRNAYGAITADSPKPAASQNQPSNADILLNWKDSQATQGDDVPDYGGQQTPLSQQATLASLPLILRARKIKLLGVLATDPMDEAFLIQTFKKASRDIRLFLRDPDLIYLHTPDAGSLNGTLLLSNYILNARNQAWTSSAATNHRISFSSAIQEAQYNALLLLFDDQSRAVLSSDDLVEWNWPSGSATPDGKHPAEAAVPVSAPTPKDRTVRPPLWLAVMGTAGNLPVSNLIPKPDVKALNLDSLAIGAPQYLSLACCAILALLGAFHISGLCFPNRLPKLFAYDFYLLASTKTCTASKALCHAAALLSLALLQLLFGSGFIFFRHAAGPYYGLRWGVLVVTTALLAMAFQVLIGLAVFYKKNWSDVQKETLSRRPLAGTVMSAAVFLIIGYWWVSAAFSVNYTNAFLHLRDLTLVSGVAPVLPIAFMLMTMYLGTWAYLRRLTYWDYRRPCLPNEPLDSVLPSDFTPEIEGIDRCLLGTLENTGWTTSWLFIFILGFLAFRPWFTLDMIEPGAVHWIAFVLFGLSFLVVTLNWLRFINIWSRLRDLLEGLERLPIQAAFESMPRERDLPIWRWGVSDSSFLPMAQAAEKLRALKQEDGAFLDSVKMADLMKKVSSLGKDKDAGLGNAGVWRSLASSWNSAQPEVMELLPAANAPRQFVRTTGGEVRATPNPLVNSIRQTGEAITELLNSVIPSIRSGYWEVDPNAPAPAEPPRKFTLAAQLIALRYYSYIRYVVSELRNLLFFLVIAFSLLFLAFHTYAFRADQAIDLSFLGLFLVMGGGIFVVLYQMEVDAILSRLSGGDAGKVGWNFYLDLLKYGAVPLLTILGAHVPLVSNFVLQWLQPSLEAVH